MGTPDPADTVTSVATNASTGDIVNLNGARTVLSAAIASPVDVPLSSHRGDTTFVPPPDHNP